MNLTDSPTEATWNQLSAISQGTVMTISDARLTPTFSPLYQMLQKSWP